MEEMLRTSYDGEIERLGDEFLFFMNPKLKSEKSVTSSWPLCSFKVASLIVLGYLSLVFIAKGYNALFVKQKKGKKEAEDVANSNISFSRKISAEPIVGLQALYNLCQVLLCAYMIYETVMQITKHKFSLICNDFKFSRSGIAGILWVFYVSKVFDFLDTVFIVLRGKWRQLSFLHWYHHFTIYFVYWINIRAGYDGDVYLTIILNSFVHLVMYAYYLARTFNVRVPKVLKMLVTRIQMIQFITMNLQACYILYFGCAYPSRVTWMYLVYIISLFILFQRFFNSSYAGERNSKKKKA